MKPGLGRKLAGGAVLLGVTMLAPAGSVHALLYGALLILFGRSLLPGRIPAVTAIARRMRGGTLPDELVRYTRQVTWAWCLFCAAQLAASALLAGLAPHRDWAFFVNILNLPLLAAMAAGEYAIRRLRFPSYRHASPSEMLRAMRRPFGR